MSYELPDSTKVGVYQLDDDPDCSPHPFDGMAIYALYQTMDR